jgi:hypothetical protein
VCVATGTPVHCPERAVGERGKTVLEALAGGAAATAAVILGTGYVAGRGGLRSLRGGPHLTVGSWCTGAPVHTRGIHRPASLA